MTVEQIILLIIMLAIPVATMVYGVYLAIYATWKNKRFAKKHPDFLEFQAEVFEKAKQVAEMNEEIKKQKKAIDEIIAEMPYLTEEAQLEVEEKLAVLRANLEEYRKEIVRPAMEEKIMLNDRLKAWEKQLIEDKELIYF